MAELNLKSYEEDTLRLNIGEDSFLIPLATSLTLEEATAVIGNQDEAIAFFKRYIREDVTKNLKMKQWRDILIAWTNASRTAAGGMDPGESEASRGS